MQALNEPTIITLILGLIQSALIILAGLTINRKRMILFLMFAGLISISQHFLLGAYFATTTAAAGFIRNSIALGGLKHKWLNSRWFIILFATNIIVPWVIIKDWSYPPNFIEIIALLSPMLAQASLFFPNIVHTKLVLIIAGITWMTYLTTINAWGQLFGEAFSIIANILAIIAYGIKRRQGNTPKQIDQLSITDTITVITSTITIIKPDDKNHPKE